MVFQLQLALTIMLNIILYVSQQVPCYPPITMIYTTIIARYAKYLIFRKNFAQI